MKLICVTGIDGAGKTSIAQNLVVRLKESGYEARYIYGRTYPVVSRLLMAAGRATILRKQNLWTDYPSYSSEKRRVMRNPLLTRIYTGAILADYFVQIWWKLAPYVWRRNAVIVLDRYVYDTVISDLAAHLEYTQEAVAKVISRGLRIVPVPNLTAVVDLPEEVAMSRKDDVPHIEYLQERRSYYQSLAHRGEVLLLEGVKPLEELQNELFTLSIGELGAVT